MPTITWNLCYNLIREGFKIQAWMQGDEVWLRLQDEGIGIPQSALTRIFGRFYREDGTTSGAFWAFWGV